MIYLLESIHEPMRLVFATTAVAGVVVVVVGGKPESRARARGLAELAECNGLVAR